MGNSCTCEKIETEEEMIGRIMTSLALKDIESVSAYENFLKCIVNRELNFFSFQNYLISIVGDNKYSKIQKTYFENLSKLEGINYENMKKIGIMIISLSKGCNAIKTNLLISHFNYFYLNQLFVNEIDTIKEEIDSNRLIFSLRLFVSDVIDCNTDHCLTTCREFMQYDGFKNVSNIWNLKRKRKLLNNILQNIENIEMKFLRNREELEKYQYASGDALKSYRSKNMSDDSEDESECKEVKPLFVNAIYDIIIINEFIELTYPQLNGEFIRNFLYDEYMKDKTFEKVCY
jgi:hypothetical protein